MKIAIIAFTRKGGRFCCLVCSGLKKLGYEVEGAIPELYSPKSEEKLSEIKVLKETAGEWVKKAFDQSQALLFIGAAGIAVRLTAPYIKDKRTDPAVLVMDEAGKYCISLLSGHLGGANDLARLIGGMTGAQPVITTATDLEGRFAVDLFARDNGLRISDMKLAKQISAEILDGGLVSFFSDFPIEGKIPRELSGGENERYHIRLTAEDDRSAPDTLFLYPPAVVAGIGCRKGAKASVIEACVEKALQTAGIAGECLAGIASVDRKAKEPGLLAFAKSRHLDVAFFTPKELEAVSGDFTESDFVRKTVGTGNVCERAALALGKGRLLLPKQAQDGVTVALAARDWKGYI